jgi:FkbM family methyltransferase
MKSFFFQIPALVTTFLFIFLIFEPTLSTTFIYKGDGQLYGHVGPLSETRSDCVPLSLQEFMISDLTFAQHELDQRMKRYITGSHGIYVESGAHDGVSFSNTMIYSLQRCWSGILVEPSIVSASAARKNRPIDVVVNAALVSPTQQGKVRGSFDGSFTSKIENSPNDQEVDARTLSDILEDNKINHFHWWSLDVEGFELSALQGLDFSRWSPDYINLELWNNDSAVWEFLNARGYKAVADISPWKHFTPHRDIVFQSSSATQKMTVEWNFNYSRLPTY